MIKNSIYSVLFAIGLCLNANNLNAQTEANTMAAQIAKCNANKANTWDSSKNRCVTKKKLQEDRFEVEKCGKIENPKQREACHLKLAEQQTGLSANPSDHYQGSYNKSMVMNAVPAAYGMVMLISKASSGIKGLGDKDVNSADTTKAEAPNAEAPNTDPPQTDKKAADAKDGGNKKESSCMSKKILGAAGVIGIATDFYMKSQAKKKMDKLKDDYSVEVGNTSFEAQKTAFDYLKKQQETVIEIAEMEKKRNMALLVGYGAAAGFAAYEIGTGNSNCK